MKPQDFVKSFQKIHVAFYNQLLEIKKLSENEVILMCKNEQFKIENHIETRFRLIFPDYVGKIGNYRNLFGYIMNNGDNVCDTSDFIDLSLSHIKNIHEYIQNTDIELLKQF
jgi:hypothetical protein